MGVLGFGVLGTLGAKQLTAHAQVNHEMGAILQRENKVLAETLGRLDGVALYGKTKFLGRLVATNHSPVGHHCGLHFLANEVSRERGSHGFNFG